MASHAHQVAKVFNTRMPDAVDFDVAKKLPLPANQTVTKGTIGNENDE
jgi:hypothetical protein